MNLRAPLLLAALLLLLPALALAADSERPDLARLFAEHGVDGCLVVRRGADVIRVNPERASTGFRPASTFKIVNALVALESGVAPDTEFLLRWDGVQREVPAWNRDLTLEQAFRASAVWYFVEIGRRNGRERLGAALRALDYGNADVSGSDQFWLDGPLRISADEQVRYLDRLARGAVPFSARSLGLLRQMMLTETGPGWALYGKTGLALDGGGEGDTPVGLPVGWFVGWVQQGDSVTPFALNLSPKGGAALTPEQVRARLEITKSALRSLGILPAQ